VKRLRVLAIVWASCLLSPVRAQQLSPQPIGQPGSWRLAFDDDFDGARLDTTKWRPNWLGSDDKAVTKPVNAEEVSCYDPSQIRQEGGELLLVAEARACANWDYASGLVHTDRRFNFVYGYAEARMWMPDGVGVWPAFWLNGQRNPLDGEIDVVEASGTDVGRYHFHYQCGDKRCSPGGTAPVAGATSGWHTYAVRWSRGSIEWYYDGIQVYARQDDVPTVPHYLVVNLGLRKGPKGYTLPATLRVDYVRVWQQQLPAAGLVARPAKEP